jgi:L-rhamnose isomerase
VWDYYCTKMDTPSGQSWLDETRAYEKNVLSKRV